MHIVVCAKRVPDPEPSAIPFRIDPATWQRVEVPGLQMVVSPYDEQAIEVALRVREHLHEDVRITVLSLGQEEDVKLFKRVFSWEVDAGVLLCDAAFDGGDGCATAVALAAAVRKLGDVDLVLAGRQAADFDQGVVGPSLAELLDLPLLPLAAEVRVGDRTVEVERMLDTGSETLAAELPALVTISNEVGPPRQPSMRQMMRAGRMKPDIWSAADLGVDAGELGAAGARLVVDEVFLPEPDHDCEFVTGDTAEAQAMDLARRLRELRVLP